jgi:hypothetical protein
MFVTQAALIWHRREVFPAAAESRFIFDVAYIYASILSLLSVKYLMPANIFLHK